MNRAHHPSQQEGYDGRDRREEYSQQHPASLPVPSYQPPPPISPPHTSPFAFTPPPLSSAPLMGSSSRPPLLAHHSEPPPIAQQQQFSVYASMKPQPPNHHSYSYASNAQMGYGPYSAESERHSPPPPTNRVPNLDLAGQPHNGGIVPSQSSPAAGSLQYRQSPVTSYGLPGPGAQPTNIPLGRSAMYPQSGFYATAYSPPTSAELPRSLSYPSGYAQSTYPSYFPGNSVGTPLQQSSMPSHPSLVRHNTLGGGGLPADARGIAQMGAYGYQSRMPVADRPFKCDECVQSFNRNHDLKRHKRIHLSVKPFGCDKCGKTFSRKDALRRHWLVKGCRGEDGATAPILPLYPINTNNDNQSPAQSPSSPPIVSPTSASSNGESAPSFSAPPRLSHPVSDMAKAQVIVTPSEAAGQQLARTSISDPASGLEEPIVMDTGAGSVESSSGLDSAEAMGADPQAGGYFQGLVGVQHDTEAQGHTSPYSRFSHSPSQGVHGHHPYRRPTLITASPGLPPQAHSGQPSPTAAYTPGLFAPSSLGSDGKPAFDMPFPQAGPYGMQASETVLASNLDGVKMEKVSSQDTNLPETWQRWHRPSFPFPAPPMVNYQFTPSSPIDINGAAVPTQGYSQ